MPDNRSPVPVTLATAANDLLRRLNVTWRRAASRLGSLPPEAKGLHPPGVRRS